jgi:hypothetical protein
MLIIFYSKPTPMMVFLALTVANSALQRRGVNGSNFMAEDSGMKGILRSSGH